MSYDLLTVIERLFEQIGATLRGVNETDPESVARLYDHRRAIDLGASSITKVTP